MHLSKTKIAFIIGIILIAISIPIIILGYQKYNNFAQIVGECNINRISNNNNISNATTITNNECNIAIREATIGYQLQTLGEILLVAGIIIIAVRAITFLYHKRR
ncbi:MAG TPA: hypothetical protein VFZ46_06670 [Nitrososphaeraceae archaeon]